MAYCNDFHPLSKLYYRPIEAAIRWCGLARHEHHILAVLKHKNLPEPHDFPRWPALRRHTELIYDAILNGDLACRWSGMMAALDLDSPHLMVRHADLKAWMQRTYPDQKPPFLFSKTERDTDARLTHAASQALLTEQEALKLQLKQCQQQCAQLRAQHEALHKPCSGVAEPVSERGETTYLNIIGAMLALLLGHTPSGQPYSTFTTQEAIVSALIAHYGNVMGCQTALNIFHRFASNNFQF